MSKSDNSLRQLIEQYLKDVENKGFSIVDFIYELLKNEEDLISRLNKAYEGLLLRAITEIDEEPKEQYYKLAELIIKPEKPIQPTALRRGIQILYVIHQKKYGDCKEFLEILHRELNIPNTIGGKLFVLGPNYGYLYAGLSVIIHQYETRTQTYWEQCSYEGRVSIWEEVENRLYEDMLIYKVCSETYEKET